MGILQDAAKRLLHDDLEQVREQYESLSSNHEFLKETISELQLQEQPMKKLSNGVFSHRARTRRIL